MPLNSPHLRTQHGGTMFGLIAGLLVGLVVAVLVAVYVNKAPVPFVNKTARVPPTSQQPVDPANAPDPNRSLYGKDAPAGSVPPSSGPPAISAPPPAPVPNARRNDDPIASFYTGPGSSSQTSPAARTPSTPSSPSAPSAPESTGTYYLQVGAFRVIEDAEALKARLAFMGFEARLETADVPKGTVNRVRLGPFAKLDDMNRSRARLAENGIEAAVVKK
jgi:cell division protein FtsN